MVRKLGRITPAREASPLVYNGRERARGASSPRKGPCPPLRHEDDEPSFLPDSGGLQAHDERRFVGPSEKCPTGRISISTRNRRKISSRRRRLVTRARALSSGN